MASLTNTTSHHDEIDGWVEVRDGMPVHRAGHGRRQLQARRSVIGEMTWLR